MSFEEDVREGMEKEFPVGTRVKVVEYGDSMTGTITGYDADYFHLKRDDGMEGGGPDFTWLTEYPGKSLCVFPLEEAAHPASTHIMGLSPETIDPTAYAAFMAGLEWGGL